MSAHPAIARGTLALVRRELIHATRQPTRLAAAIATPVIIWVLLASGFAEALSSDGRAGYDAYLIPGVATLTVVFSSIFAAMSLIDDRHNGFLQSVLVSPLPTSGVVTAKALACALIATLQGGVILLAMPLTGPAPTVAGFFLAMLALALASIGVTGLCIALAWKIDSTQGFHGVMNLLLFPMWLLSGSIFPIDSASPWVAMITRLNPLSWPTSAARDALGPGAATLDATTWLLSVAFAAAGLALPVLVLAWTSRPPTPTKEAA